MNILPNSQIGIVGLGVMGRNLAENIAEHGFSVAGYDKDPAKVQDFLKNTTSQAVHGMHAPEEFIGALSKPRSILILVPAGPIVDSVIRDLMPFLEPGDLVIDSGNSHYKDTDLRAKALAEKGLLFMGVGISGGEYGARHGPSLMPGGPEEAYKRVRPIFEAVAARVDRQPCVAYLGPHSAGHYVKMVHNGIEYGLMQLIAETYDLMKRGLGLSDEDLYSVYTGWNKGPLNSYLLEITANIFREVDQKTGKLLVNLILDEARQKGTGKWASQDAMDLQTPLPVIDAAVAARDLSAFKTEREAASQMLKRVSLPFHADREVFLIQLKEAFYVAMLITFAQGMALLRAASKSYAYELDLEDVARIWRGGCIIRAGLLEDIRSAYRAHPELDNLLKDNDLGQAVLAKQEDLRTVVRAAAELGLPTPCLMAALAYLDGYRSAWLPANLIQAQRDYFGAHTYERVDERGAFHTVWQAE